MMLRQGIKYADRPNAQAYTGKVKEFGKKKGGRGNNPRFQGKEWRSGDKRGGGGERRTEDASTTAARANRGKTDDYMPKKRRY